MKRHAGLAVALALVCAAAAAGCGLGPGKSKGEAQLLVTRDYGNENVAGPKDAEVRESDTVIGLLEKETDITTRYGDNFVQSIDGIQGGESDGRRFDWFFYVNGVESPRGGGDVTPGAGDRIWWDYRDWTKAMRVPAVVGSYPEPFAHGFEGRDYETRIDCLGDRAPCELVQGDLKREGVDAGFGSESGPALRILVGPWESVSADPAAAQIDEGPEVSGVFAGFDGTGAGATLSGLSPAGEPVGGPLAQAGLVAAVRYQDQPPTWVVTGVTPAGVTAAAQAFTSDQLEGRYAVIAETGGTTHPVPEEAGSQ